MLNYEMLKKFVVKIKLKKSINMGYIHELFNYYDDYELFIDNENFNENYEIDENENLILKNEKYFYLNVQKYNHNFEIFTNNRNIIDICFDDDKILNEYCELIEILDVNNHFYEKRA